MKLCVKEGRYAVARLKAIADIPREGFMTLSVTEEEISLVCREDQIPACAEKMETGFSLIKIEGTLDFSLVGIIAKVSGILTACKIPLFCVSTFDTDYFLVYSDKLEKAIDALAGAGYQIG